MASSKANQITTRTLMARLFRTSTFQRFAARYGDELQQPTLSQYITRLCEQRSTVREQVIRRAGLDRVYGHQIFSGMRQPARDKVIQLAFGFDMDVEEAQTLLRAARQSTLYPRIERDAAILFCLNKHMSIDETQLLLAELSLPLLGKEPAREPSK